MRGFFSGLGIGVCLVWLVSRAGDAQVPDPGSAASPRAAVLQRDRGAVSSQPTEQEPSRGRELRRLREEIDKVVEGRLSDHEKQVAALKYEVGEYKLAVANYRDFILVCLAVVGLATAVIGGSLISARRSLKGAHQAFNKEGAQTLKKVAENAAAEALRRDKRVDLMIRGFRYVVEEAKSDIAVGDVLKNSLSELYYGLGLFSSDAKEVKKGLKALTTKSDNSAWVEWINEVRVLWDKRREVEVDPQARDEIAKLIDSIDSTMSRVLHEQNQERARAGEVGGLPEG